MGQAVQAFAVLLLVTLFRVTFIAAQVHQQPPNTGEAQRRRRESAQVANLFQAHAIAAEARKKAAKGMVGTAGGKGEKFVNTGGKAERKSGKGSIRGKGESSNKRGKANKDKSRGTKDDDDDRVNQMDSTQMPATNNRPRPVSAAPQAKRPTLPTSSSSNSTTTTSSAPVVAIKTGSPVRRTTTLSPVPQLNPRCAPTIGPCINSFAAMTTALNGLADGNTVAICANSTIQTTIAATIAADNTKLCCAGTNCTVRSLESTDRNLLVTGSAFTVLEVVFIGGSSDVSGGNVAIFGAGNHQILDSRFQGGTSRIRGGNVFIRTEGNVLVNGSAFADGTAEIGGGGLAIESAFEIDILDSEFIGNDAPEGGGLYTTRASATLPGQRIVIEDSRFLLNTGQVGGGFLVSNLGSLPSLTVMNTELSENKVDTVGAAGAVVEFLTNLSLKYSSNSGRDNKATQFCDGVLTAPDATAPQCLAITAVFPK